MRLGKASKKYSCSSTIQHPGNSAHSCPKKIGSTHETKMVNKQKKPANDKLAKSPFSIHFQLFVYKPIFSVSAVCLHLDPKWVGHTCGIWPPKMVPIFDTLILWKLLVGHFKTTPFIFFVCLVHLEFVTEILQAHPDQKIWQPNKTIDNWCPRVR